MVVRLLWFSGRALVAQPRGVIWLSGCCGSVAEHWWLKPEVSQLGSTSGDCWLFFTFLYFCIITSKFILTLPWRPKFGDCYQHHTAFFVFESKKSASLTPLEQHLQIFRWQSGLTTREISLCGHEMVRNRETHGKTVRGLFLLHRWPQIMVFLYGHYFWHCRYIIVKKIRLH